MHVDSPIHFSDFDVSDKKKNQKFKEEPSPRRKPSPKRMSNSVSESIPVSALAT